jgi:hypothetical protein
VSRMLSTFSEKSLSQTALATLKECYVDEVSDGSYVESHLERRHVHKAGYGGVAWIGNVQGRQAYAWR